MYLMDNHYYGKPNFKADKPHFPVKIFYKIMEPQIMTVIL